jgi:aminoglycoside phosphotransferase (APT) family kinase protein
VSGGKMHDGEADIDEALVRRLLAAQLPRWADLPLGYVHSAGTDNALYRLGDEMVVRLPRIAAATNPIEREHTWLPRLRPLLPLQVPLPLAKGTPGEGYPWPWSVYGWLEGEAATGAPIADERAAGTALGRFVSALQRIDSSGAPQSGSRGVPLVRQDADVREAIAALGDTIDTAAATAAWDAALRVPEWQGPPVWIHGDLHSANLLVSDGRLSGVIDFGCVCAGDPAGDLIGAWMFLTGQGRDAFRAALTADDATWERGRGWALSIGLIALPYYRDTNPVFAGIARRAIAETLA